MYVTKNFIALQNKLICLPEPQFDVIKTSNIQLVLSIQEELIKNGFVLSKYAFDRLLCSEPNIVIEYHMDILLYLEKFHEFTDHLSIDYLFKDVIDYDIIEKLYADLIYLYSKYPQNEFPELIRIDGVSCKVVNLVEEDEFVSICFTDKLRKKRGFNLEEIVYFKWFVDYQDELNLFFPNIDDCKANLEFILSNFKNFKQNNLKLWDKLCQFKDELKTSKI